MIISLYFVVLNIYISDIFPYILSEIRDTIISVKIWVWYSVGVGLIVE